MSNASNLSTLANVLDDGSDGQFLKSTGSGGVAFDTVAAGATVYSSASDLPLTGNTVGDMAYVSAATTAKVVNQTTGSVSTEDATRLYIYSGTGWYSVAFITQNPTISTVHDAGGNPTPFSLATDGTTATVVTITANDPESVPLTYRYSVTDGSLNGCTITGADGTSARVAGTAYTDNVFTVTPHASNEATFEITFTASDGINQATSVNDFSLSFVTTIAGSAKTSMLIASTISNNTNVTNRNSISSSTPSQVIVDSSSPPLSITINSSYSESEIGLIDDAFSPYRSGGYSMNFGSGASLKFAEASTANFNMGTNAFTIEMWIRPATTSSGSKRFFHNRISGMANGRGHIFQNGSNLYATYRGDNGTDYELTASGVLTADTWTHVCLLRNTSDNTLKLYYNGTLNQSGQSVSVPSTVGIYNSTSNTNVGLADFGDIANLRVVNGTAISPSSSSILEKPTNVTNTVLLMIGGNFADYSGNAPQINNYYGPPEIKAYGPLDYVEYSAADHGGSVYFDNLSSSNHDVSCTLGSAIGTGDFSISGWFYPPEVHGSGNKRIWTLGGNNNANGLSLLFLTNGQIRFDFPSTGTSFGGAGNSLAGKWQHFCVRRVSGTATLHLDGVQKWTQSNNTVNLSATNLVIGRDTSGLYGSTGYVSDFKISTSSLEGTTIPTTPTSSTGALVHIKGGGSSIVNKAQTPKKINLVGSISGKVGTGTNGKAFSSFNNNNFIKLVDKPAINQPITIEGFVYRDSYTNENPLIGIWLNSSNHVLLRPGYYNNHLELIHKLNGTAVEGTSTNSNAIPRQTWKHFAMTRDDNGNWKAYADGQQVNSLTESGAWDIVNNSSVEFHIGNAGSASFDGRIQDIRITESLRYTLDSSGNFTAPSAPIRG